ncbi:MAG: protein-glutamate O-methyltransferase CheR [Desulfuromusa sp.]|nr:protein-glutamate O-methyltransferase CheR [Desulfuromusa sp.]
MSEKVTVSFITVSEEDSTISADSDKTLTTLKLGLGELPEEQIALSPSPFIGNSLDDKVYQEIADILRQQQNFFLEGYKVLCIKRRIAARIRAIGYHEPVTYIDLLRDNIREQEQLLATLSIHVSQFFRNKSVFQALENKFLPGLLDISRRNRSKLRIWSVGCANGEEPYSIALLFQKWRRKGDLLSIVGTDLSPEALIRAKRGYFPAERICNVPSEVLTEYFINHGDQYQLIDSVREHVQFFRHDILADKPLYRATLILCRNLLIYFSREQQQQVLKILATALLPGGYLVLGRAETMATDCRNLFTCIDPAERIYLRLPESQK